MKCEDKVPGESDNTDFSESLLCEDLHGFLEKNGISKMPTEMVSDLGKYLMIYIRGSAERLVKSFDRGE